jgi:hypothetical protein
MRWFHPRAVAIVGALAVAAAVAGSLVAQPPGRRAAIRRTRTTTRLTAEAAAAPDRDGGMLPGHDPHTKQVMIAGPMTAEVEGRLAHLRGRVEVFDRVPGGRFIWLLRVYSYNKEHVLLREHHYLEAAVVMPPGETRIAPVFDDTIELDPGGYDLWLTLYAAPPGFPFDEIKVGEYMGHRTSKVDLGAKVVISP